MFRVAVSGVVGAADLAENQPVFVHCKRGSDRTGTVIAVYRMRNDGWTDDEAIKEAKKFGFGWWQFWMKDYIEDYYKKLERQEHESKPVDPLNGAGDRFSGVDVAAFPDCGRLFCQLHLTGVLFRKPTGRPRKALLL